MAAVATYSATGQSVTGPRPGHRTEFLPADDDIIVHAQAYAD